MKCAFIKPGEDRECTEKCKYFNTCARNPHGYKREVDKYGKRKVDKNND